MVRKSNSKFPIIVMESGTVNKEEYFGILKVQQPSFFINSLEQIKGFLGGWFEHAN